MNWILQSFALFEPQIVSVSKKIAQLPLKIIEEKISNWV